jgi:tetratricopeptide (TPR) repeat protein
MPCLRRLGLLLLTLGTVTAALVAQPPPPKEVPDKKADADKPGTVAEPVLPPANRRALRKLEAARDYLKVESWGEGLRQLQSLLDAEEDVFVLRPGKTRVSARAEAALLLDALPPKGQEFYHLHYGVAAREALTAARRQGDVRLLGDVVRRYFHTPAGAEALDLLAVHHLDHGQAGAAALCYERLLRHPDKLSPPALLRAALAFHATGWKDRERQAWAELTARADRDGLHLGKRTVSLDALRRELDRQPRGRLVATDWSLVRGDPARSGTAPGGLPFLEPRWRHELATLPDGTRRLLDQVIPAYAAEGQPLLPGSCPLAVGGKVVYRSYGAVRAVELATGRELWQAPLAAGLEGLLREPGRRVHLLNAWLPEYANDAGEPGGTPVTGLPGKQGLLFENSLAGALSADGRHVYVIDDLALPPPPALLLPDEMGKRRSLGPLAAAVLHNRLRALDLETGAVAWELGNHRGDPAETYFLGPPLPVAGRLYALQEKQGELRLLCLDPDGGAVLWSQALLTPRDKLHLDPGRRLQALHLAYADGLLVCPTNAGAVFAIDLVSRNLAWVHVYTEAKQPDPSPQLPPPDETAAPTATPLSPAWKHAAPLLHGNRVLFTAADDDALHCVSLRDGGPLWKARRQETDLYVAGVFAGQVLIVGKNGCRAVELATGKPASWQVTTGLPAGLGAGSGDVYYLPLQSGAICAVDVKQGRVAGTAETHGAEGRPVPGNLLFHEGILVSQGVLTVAAYPELRRRLDEVERVLANNPRDPAALTERGELRLDSGEVAAAVADLRAALKAPPPSDLLPRTHRKLYDALTLLLQRDFPAGEEYLDEYRGLFRPPAPPGATAEVQFQLEREEERRRNEAVRLIARGRERQPGRLGEALDAYRELHARDTGRLVASADDPGLHVRPDAWVRGRVANLLTSSRGEQAKEVRAYLEQTWPAVRASADESALPQFAALFGSAGSAREAALLQAERLTGGEDRGGALAAESLLLPLLEQKDDPTLAARAWECWARLLARKGLPDEAAAAYRRLAADYPAVVVRDGKTGAALLADLALDPRFLPVLDAPPPPWRNGLRVEQEQVTGRPQPAYISFEPAERDSPFFRRHILALELPSCRFKVLDRTTGAELWGCKPDLSASLRQHLQQALPAYVHCRCRARGHLAVVSLGYAVFGIDLLDRRVRWSRNLADAPFDPNRMQVTVILDGRPTLMQAVAGGNPQPLGGPLGPLGPDAATVHTARGLLGLDPLTGGILWRRDGLDLGFESFGDGEHVYLVNPLTKNTRCVRARDGAAVSVPDFFALFEQTRQTLGRHLLTQSPGERGGVRLRLHDVHTGQVVWTKQVPAHSLVLLSRDPTLTGTVDPDGSVSVVDLRTRRQVLAANLDPEHLRQATGVHVLRDRSRFYLAIGHAPDPRAGVSDNPWPLVRGLESVSVNGMVYAYDRATWKLLWYSRVPHQALLAESAEEGPVLLFAAGLRRQVKPSPLAVVEFRVASIDKETGKRLFDREVPANTVAFHELRVDGRGGTVDLVGATLTIRHLPLGK